jgi:putative flippase GtrA
MSVRTPIVYVAVAGLCLLLHNAVLIVADSVATPLWAAVLISFMTVAVTGYLLHGLFTFRQPLKLLAFARYAIAMSVNIPLAFVTTWFWHDPVGLAMTMAAPIASLCMLALNFVLGRWAIAAPDARLATR